MKINLDPNSGFLTKDKKKFDKRLALYEPSIDDVKLIYKVPSTIEEDSNYCMRLNQGNIEIKKIEEPITDYIGKYRSFANDREKYLSKK